MRGDCGILPQHETAQEVTSCARLQDFGEYKKVCTEFANEIEGYDDYEGGSKHGKPNTSAVEKTKEKDYQRAAVAGRGAGGNRVQIGGGRPSFGRGSGVIDRVPQAFLNQLQELKDAVMFATKTQHKPCPKYNLEHPVGQCTRSDNQKVKNDHIAPLLHRMAATEDKKLSLKLGHEMVAAATKGAQNTYKSKAKGP
jgi:hypothetical protein